MNCLRVWTLGDDCDALSVSAAQEIRGFGVFPGLQTQKVRQDGPVDLSPSCKSEKVAAKPRPFPM